MVAPLKRRIEFYWMSDHSKQAQANILHSLSQVRALPFGSNPNTGRYLPLENETFLSLRFFEFITQGNIRIKGTLCNTRIGDLPSIDKQGTEALLTLGQNEGLLEKSHFILFPHFVNGVFGFLIAWEYNHTAPKVRALKHYLELKTGVKNLHIHALLKQDILRELDRAESYRFFHIRFTRQLFQKVDERQHPDVCSLVNFDQGIRGETYDIRVTTSRGRNDQLRPGIFRQLISLLRTGDARPFISTAKVKYRDSTDGTIKPVNLLEENIEKEKYVAREDEHHRSINSNAMFSALEEAYAEITRDGILQDAILANFGGIDDAPGGGV